MDRQIVCFTVPALEIALARIGEPSLRHRPVAVAARTTPHTAIQEVSPEAEQEGVHAGMSIRQARQHCAGLRVLPADARRMEQGNQSILEVIQRYAPVWEPIAQGGWWMDLTGTTRLFGRAGESAARIQRDIAREYRLQGVAGVGSNKLVAQTAAALVTPAQVYEVRSGLERAFVAPLSIHALPVLHQPQMRDVVETLDDLNLRTLGEIANVSHPSLHIAVGQWAGPLSRWAMGIDPSPVILPRAQSQWEAAMDLHPDEIDDRVLHGSLSDLLQGLCRRLREHHRMCRLLVLTLRYSDSMEVTKQERIKPASCWEADLLPRLRSLFQRLFRRRVRLNRLTVGVGGLAPYEEQLSLFEDAPSPGRARRLAAALDRIVRRYGERALHYGH